MHEAKGCTITDPSILKWIFPKNCFWKVHGKWVSRNFSTLTAAKVYTHAGDRTLSISNGAHLEVTIHIIKIAEEKYPGHYDVFEHVFDAMAASFEDFSTVLHMIRSPEQFRWVLQPLTRIRLSLPLARKLGFVCLTIGQDPYKAASYFMIASYN